MVVVMSFFAFTTCVSKRFFSILNDLIFRLKWNKASINVEFNYLSNGGSGFIEIGHKFINLWLWSCHFLCLQLVYQNVFPLYWTFHSNVFAVSYINRRGIKISVEWKWFHWNWTKIDWVMAVERSCFSVTSCFFKTFFSIFNVSMGRLKWNKASINVEFNYLSNGGSVFIEIGHKFINLWLWSCHFLRLQLVYQNVFPLYWTFYSNVFAVSTINRRGIKISVEWKWFHW
jgi:hypothetical protein